MIENSKFHYDTYTLEEFKFDYGRVLNNLEVQYATRGTPEYDE